MLVLRFAPTRSQLKEDIIMGHWKVFAIVLIFAVTANARVYRLQNLDDNVYGDIVYPGQNEQSSRDLDLSFAAGDDAENDKIHPVRKMFKLVAPERHYYEVNKEVDSPVTYYKLSDAPIKKAGLEDIVYSPEKNRKLVKIGNNKGEVILELRVIANHDSI